MASGVETDNHATFYFLFDSIKGLRPKYCYYGVSSRVILVLGYKGLFFVAILFSLNPNHRINISLIIDAVKPEAKQLEKLFPVRFKIGQLMQVFRGNF